MRAIELFLYPLYRLFYKLNALTLLDQAHLRPTDLQCYLPNSHSRGGVRWKILFVPIDVSEKIYLEKKRSDQRNKLIDSIFRNIQYICERSLKSISHQRFVYRIALLY